MTTADTEPPRRKLIPTSHIISVLPTVTAHVYTNIHPILVLTLYYVFFPSLVADPVSTLKKSLAPLAHLQIIYCVVCLPPFAGSPSPKAEAPKTPKKRRVQFAHTAKGPTTKPATLASRLIVCCSMSARGSHQCMLCGMAMLTFTCPLSSPLYTPSPSRSHYPRPSSPSC